MIIEALCVGPMQANCYILAASVNSEAIIIDPGDECTKIKRRLDKYKLKPAFIINTHAHADHIGCDDEFDVPVYIHSKDAPLLKDPALNLSSLFMSSLSVKSKIKTIEDKENIELGQIQLKVMHTPGHTPGSICLLLEKPCSKILFTGDTLFCQGIGRTDFPGADASLLLKSIKDRLFKLADDTIVYPGHGPSSTIGQEKSSNPFLHNEGTY